MLRRPAEHIIVDDLNANSVTVTGAVIRIEGYGEFTAAQVLECYQECPAPCVPGTTTVTVTVPESCECPYSWAVRVVRRACSNKYDVQSTFNSERVYEFVSQDGSTPTAAAVATAIFNQINADPYRFVNATNPGAGVILLTERDCDTLLGSCGIEAYVTSGTVVVGTTHVDPVFPAWRMAQLNPIRWGMVGGDPRLGRCGTYCVYYLHIRGTDDIQDIDMSSTWSSYDREVFFYVNSADADYDTFWVDELAAVLDCITT